MATRHAMTSLAADNLIAALTDRRCAAGADQPRGVESAVRL